MSTSTVDTSDIDGSVLTGPTLLTELILQLENAKADLEARPREASNDTISASWTITGVPIQHLPVSAARGYRWQMQQVAAGKTTAHEMDVREDGAGTTWQLRPRVDGSADSSDEFGYDFVNLNWFFDKTPKVGSNLVWHAGNLNPALLVPTSLKTNGRVYKHLEVLTGAAGVAVDATAQSAYFLENDQAMTLTFTWPAASADADLGDNFKTTGEINIINTTGHGTLTLAHASAVTDSEEIGSRGTGATEMYTLKWECWVIGSSRYVQFTWIAA